MAAGFVARLRNARNDAITADVGNAGRLRIYSGTRPATGGAITTLLVELTLATPFAPASSAGVLTLGTITSGTAVATGTATWCRVYRSDGTTICFDASVGTSGADFILSTTAITSGATVSATSGSITDGNP